MLQPDGLPAPAYIKAINVPELEIPVFSALKSVKIGRLN
jgi:hypothetical protein